MGKARLRRLQRLRFILSGTALLALLGAGFQVPAMASAAPAATSITITLSPAVLDYGHQATTVSGIVSTTSGPADNAAVTVSYQNASGQAAQLALTTDTNGGYAGTIADPQAAAQEVTASVAATASITSASASAELGITQDPVTITASFAEPAVNPGVSDQMSGTASYVSDGATYPLATSQLSITMPGSFPYDPPSSATVTTRSDGSFTYTPAPGYGAELTYTVSSAATAYLQAGQATVNVGYGWSAEISSFTGKLGQDGVLHLSACAGIATVLADGPLLGPLDFQYKSGPGARWKTLGTATPHPASYCADAVDLVYSGQFTAPADVAYYRAYAPTVSGQTSAVSKTIRVWRYRTKITDFTVTPSRAGHGARATVSGRLWQDTKKWEPDRGQKITITFRFHHVTYSYTDWLRTSKSGRFSGRFRVWHTTSLTASYAGASHQFAAVSKTVTVRLSRARTSGASTGSKGMSKAVPDRNAWQLVRAVTSMAV